MERAARIGSAARARRPPAPLAIALAVALALALVPAAGTDEPAGAVAAAPPGHATARPRLLYDPGQEAELRDRLGRDPYRTLFLRNHARALAWDARPLGDDTKEAHRDLSRAATWFALEYALDRTVVGGAIVAFPHAAARQATGDRVRDLLVNLYPHDRMGVPPPIGGPDRDISTSEEVISYATAFDTLLGAGYDLGAAHPVVVERLASVAGELHLHYVDPPTASGFANLHQNNHRTKSGAAMAVAAIALADEVPEAADWFDDGVLLVDDVLRHILITGDGAYGEGAFYYRFTLQNLLPLVAAWDRLLGDAPWVVDGIEVPAPHAHPLFRRTQRWMQDVTLPDGSLAPIDDGDPGRSGYAGALPPDLPEAAAHAWRWAEQPSVWETDGNIDLGALAIATYDDGIVPAPPSWDPSQTYVEGGTATLRSSWATDATMALVLGEHDTASEFGRDRTGIGRAPQSHEHVDPGSFLLHAAGERLVMDPGYLSFDQHDEVNRAEHHNVVLVDGQGPSPYLQASLAWFADLWGRPPAEGQSTLHDSLDGGGVAATSVATWYRATEVHRRALLADGAYLVVGDAVDGAGSTLTWPVQGNGGGTSGGTFQQLPDGGRWTQGAGRVDVVVAVADVVPTFSTVDQAHEDEHTGATETHTTLRATVAGGSAQALQVLYPTRSDQPAPTVTRLDVPGAAAVEVLDAAADRRVTIRRDGATGALSLVDEHLDGTLRLAYAEQADALVHEGQVLVRADGPGTLALRRGPGQAEVVADAPGATVDVAGLGFAPTAADGACGLEPTADGGTVHLGDERRATLRRGDGGAPGAAARGPRRVAAGEVAVLDGLPSCDADGDALTPRWELVSAPRGSAWSLSGAGAWQPTLLADVPGPYRVRLVVTDATGRASRVAEVAVVAGERCADGVDDDRDGRIDGDDPDCDGPEPHDDDRPTDPTPPPTSPPPTSPDPTSPDPTSPAAAPATAAPGPSTSADPTDPARPVRSSPATAVAGDPTYAG